MKAYVIPHKIVTSHFLIRFLVILCGERSPKSVVAMIRPRVAREVAGIAPTHLLRLIPLRANLLRDAMKDRRNAGYVQGRVFYPINVLTVREIR